MRQSEKEKQYSIEGVPKMRMPFEILRFLFFFARKDLTKLNGSKPLLLLVLITSDYIYLLYTVMNLFAICFVSFFVTK